MKDYTWPFAAVICVLVAAMAAMFGLTDDTQLQSRIVDYFDRIVSFVVGASVGAAVGGTLGYLRGKKVP